MSLVARRAEQRELARFQSSPRPEFVAVFGRRRVGKTFLIREFFHDNFCFAFTGRSNATKKEQLASFSAAARGYGAATAPPATWRDAFLILRSIVEADRRPGKKVVFLDEMPWMATDRSGFLDELGHFWNSWGMMQAEMLLIVCGSATSWMSEKFIDDVGGLHNRTTGTIELKPFTLGETEQFLQSLGVVMSRYQIIETAMIFGGIPYYLQLLRPDRSLAQNVDALCFDGRAPLAHEFHNLYASLFKNAERYETVVRALATKTRGLTRAELLHETGLTQGGRFTKTVDDLASSGFLRSYHAFGKKERDTVFQLIDPFSLFALRYLGDTTHKDPRFWSNFTPTPAHAAWSGYAFEQVCLLHTEQIRRALGISGVLTDFAAWSGGTPAAQAQIDLILDRRDGVINLCEMKYAREPLVADAGLENAVLRQRALFSAALPRIRKSHAVHSTLVTTYTPVPTPRLGVFQSIITMDDLFESA